MSDLIDYTDTSPEGHATYAELCAAKQALAIERRAWHRVERWADAYEYHAALTELVATTRELLDRGCWEYQDAYNTATEKLVSATRRVQELRADDELRQARGNVALESLRSELQQVEFAIVGLRHSTGHWPIVAQVAEFMVTYFGWERTVDDLLRFVNDNIYDLAWPAIFSADGATLAEAMAYPLPPGATGLALRLCVGAEHQMRDDLHRVYEAWMYESPAEAVVL